MSIGNISSNGRRFCGLLTIVFITLKLTGTIKWSWLWVLSPLWISFIIFAIILISITLYYRRKDNVSYKSDRLRW